MPEGINSYNILRLKLNTLKNEDTKDGVVFNILEKEVKYLEITIGDSELIRIINHINPLNNRKKEDNKQKYKDKIPFIKDLIILKVGRCSKKYTDFKEHDGILTLNTIDNDGVVIKTTEYKRIACGSNAVRNQKVFLVSLESYDKVSEILRCGMPHNALFEIPAKYNAYISLPTSDSTPLNIETPNIVVIKDYKKTIFGKFDVVSQNKGVWSVNETDKHDILPFDGGGLIDIEAAEKWASQLYMRDSAYRNKCVYKQGLDYIPAAFQIRVISGIKGNLYTFPIKDFAKKYDVRKIVDAWGKEWDLFDDKIDCILTASQFKFLKKEKSLSWGYSSFAEWKENFDNGIHGYKYTFNVSKVSPNPNKMQNNVVTAYQPLQTLHDLTDGEITALCHKTVNKIIKAHTDYKSFLMYRGLYDNSVDTGDEKLDCENTDSAYDYKISTFNPPFYDALKKNKDLINDSFVNGCITKDLKRMKHRAYMGKLILSGNFQTFTPDIYALAQHAFGLNVTGLLQADTVYSQYWNNRNLKCNENIPIVKELVIIRYPHISAEHCVVSLADDETARYSDMSHWYQYQNTGVVSNIYDTMAERLGNGDYDGDEIVSTSSKVFLNAARRNKTNTIIFKSEPQQEDNLSDAEKLKRVPRINDIKELIETDIRGMSNNIGTVVNKVTLLWQLMRSYLENIDKFAENMDYVKIMTIICGMTIDFAKTGIKVDIPSEIQNMIHGINKPYFMRYKDKHTLSDDKAINEAIELAGEDCEELKKARKYLDSDCTMNRICKYMESKVENINPQFGKKEIFDYQKLIKDPLRNKNNSTYKKVEAALKTLHDEYEKLSKSRRYDYSSSDYEYHGKYTQFYTYSRYTLLDIAYDGNFQGEENTINVLLDYLMLIYYENANFKKLHKYILWNAFGDEMIKRCAGDFKAKDYEISKLREYKTKAQEKINKQLKNKAQKIALPSHIPFAIGMNELEYIKRHKGLRGDYKSKRILLTCLALCRINPPKENKEPYFSIKINAKKENDINFSRIQSLSALPRQEDIKVVLLNLRHLELLDIEFKKATWVIKVADFGVMDNTQRISVSNINEELPTILKSHFRNR